ncbi:hypothetical protein K239x_47410 [Planctomycetes bacterium K23_9]|uniref:Uncharacterized protein n=1 Tax=Stieleria marina TaxID=1930275 RepID=A0A517P027_9BACT|nr:hypothetical protein K239x_47410 [Planctomycetes bacterium K23_9]
MGQNAVDCSEMLLPFTSYAGTTMPQKVTM